MNKVYSSSKSGLIIRDRWILIIDNKNNRKICTINSGKTKVGKKEINTKFFENKKINSFWQIDTSSYEEISHRDFFDDNIIEDEDNEKEDLEKVMRNNKEIYSGGSQKLSDEDIRRLKEGGLKGEDLIKTIMQNNTSMEKRTIFSQEKMLKKKKIKHLNKIWIVEPNLFNIVETFFLENERSINYMRADTFSTILVHSNFYNNARTLILEDMDNILTSAFTLRSGKQSNVVSLYQSKLNNKNLSIFNLSCEKKNLITLLDYDILTNRSGFLYKTMSQNYLLNFDNLVLCIKNLGDVVMHTMKLWDYLKHSGCLVVYSREPEYLVTLEKILFENKFALDVRIHETFLREYQVLSMRTHPNMNNKGYSGYILTAIKFNNINE